MRSTLGAALLLACGAAVHPAAAPDARALVARMTLDEKISLVHGARDPEELGMAGYWPGLPRLGIGPLRFADGPGGINANRDSTALPAPVALAATFSAEAARLYGEVLGREARALRADVVLAPHVNIVRDPLFRRNHTALSEDPVLAARIAAAEIEGIQAQGVLAQVKHLAGYNGSDNVEIDERTLHEIYLPPFEAAIRAGTASAMCAYNRINGEWACENADIQNGILRAAWGFRGFVTSDWGATHSPGAITKGLDLEMPGRPLAFGRGGPYFSEQLKAAIECGAIPESALDEAVVRIVATALNGPRKQAASSSRGGVDVLADSRAVRALAVQGAVLLTNNDAVLPLTRTDLASLALIGPTAGQLAAGFMGERGYGFERRLVSPLDALRRSAPAANVAYSPGVDLTGTPIDGVPQQPALQPDQEYKWTGSIRVPDSGDYTFMVQPAVGNGADGTGAIAIDGQPVARTGGPGFGGTGMRPKKWSSLLPTTDGRDNGRGSTHLSAGEHRIEATAHSTGEKPLDIRFAWITPAMRARQIEEAVAIARRVRTVVVFAWHGAGAFNLAENQDELIAKVGEANPRTVVVLNTGGPVAMPWKDRVRAILEMWYPGQEGGWATADLLLGRANPSGRLPVTFGARLGDAPARAARYPERLPRSGPPGSAGAGASAEPVRFTEGLAVGYRWYDQERIEPNFPFGHGLSYSTFEYSGLTVSGRTVSVVVRNASARPGAEVVQVYLGPATGSPVPLPIRALASFGRAYLRGGASRTVAFQLPARAFAYWSAEKHDWVVARGGRQVYVGPSSRDTRLHGTVD